MPITILPSIDLRGGQVVRLKQGDYDRQLSYDLDPIAVARSFVDAGATWMHVVDLDGAKQGRPVQAELIGQIVRATPTLQVEVGGGVRTTGDVVRLLSLGVDRVVVGTRALEAWDWFESLVSLPKLANRIVLAVDAKDGIVATRGWTISSGRRAVDIAQSVRGWSLAGLLYTDIAKDGMLEGPNYEQTLALAEATDVPVIASGGVGSIEHVRMLSRLPIWGAVIGRSLYEGALDLRKAIETASAAT